MSYSWINTPLLDGLEYFISMFGYFVNEARKIGSVLALLGISWYCIQLWLGTTTPRKVIVSLITKFVLFILVLNIYFPVVIGVRSLVTKWGSNAGISASTLTAELTEYMKTLETIVASENAGYDSAEAELAAAVAELSTLSPPHYYAESDFYDQSRLQEIQRWQQANQRKELAERIMEERRNTSPSWNMRTLEAIKTILIPVNLEGEKEEPITSAYFLDLQLKDAQGDPTGFLSPNAILRIALLTSQIMFQKETMAISENMTEQQEERAWYSPFKYTPIGNFSLTDIFNFILTCLCCLGIILAAIFALMQYIMCIFEYTIITSIGIVFVPTLLFDGTKDMANKIMPALLGLSIKLLVMTLCMFFAFHLFIGLAFNQIGENTTINFDVFAYVAFTILIAFVVTQNGPQIAVTLLTGNPQLSMGELVQAAATVAAAGHVAGKVAGTAGGISASGAGKLFGGAANTAGFMSEVGHAAGKAFKTAKADGHSGGSAAALAAGAVGSVAMGRAGTAFKSVLHGAGHMGMGGTGGRGSGGSRFVNRFAGNAESTLSNIDKEDKYNDTSYRYGRNENGNPLTMGEYMNRMKDKGTESGQSYYEKHGGNGLNKEFPNLQKHSNVSYVGSFPLPESRGALPAPEERKSLPPSDIIYL
jgi:type IV secretion system protein TrbL